MIRPTFYDTARELEEQYGPIRWPCCVLVARVLARNAGMEDVFRPGTPWWEDANIWDPEKPWSSVHAAADVVARVTAEPSLGAILTPRGGITWRRLTPYLGLGKFYAVQGWRRNETGHTFLLEIGPTRLDEGRVIQSSEALGLRLDEQNRPIDDFLLQFQKGLGLVELW